VSETSCVTYWSGTDFFSRTPLNCLVFKGIRFCRNDVRFLARSKRDGTRAETRFGLSAKRMSPFKSEWVSVQSTTGSRGVRISGQGLYRPCSDVQCKAAGYPLHSQLSPSLPLPCVAVCHQVPNALYKLGTRLSCYQHLGESETSNSHVAGTEKISKAAAGLVHSVAQHAIVSVLQRY